jgi:Arc/MetJ-type ribon-helix-helix transcriptional regulator
VIASQIVQELYELTAENRKGVEVYAEVMEHLARCENILDTVEAGAFISASGSVAERQAVAKLEASEARLERDLAKAQVERVRAKLRAIESAIMASATAAKMVQAEMKL